MNTPISADGRAVPDAPDVVPTEFDLLSITKQVVESSVNWNRAAISLIGTGDAPAVPGALENLLPDNVLFVHDSDARRMSTEAWNELALGQSGLTPHSS